MTRAVHQLHLGITAQGFAVTEQLTIHNQYPWTRERALKVLKLFDEAQQLLTNLSNMTPEEYDKWLLDHNFAPWPKDELVKNHKFELPVHLQTITLQHE